MPSQQETGRVGILGGTFDPIHAGHLGAALAARRALALTSVVLLPARVPPHRPQGPSASIFHRFAMAALAVANTDGLTVSDDELGAQGPSYTALTLERLIARGFDRSAIYFITGADAFAEIETWYRYPEVLDLAHFVVVSRAGVAAATLGNRLPHLRDRMRIADAALGPSPTPAIFLVDGDTPAVSSTEVRQQLRRGGSIRGLVPATVEQHILRHRLYVNGAREQ